MIRSIIKVLIIFSLFTLSITGCAYNKKSLLDYDYPPAVSQEYYTPYPYPYYYPYMPYPPYYYPYPPYFFPPYPFLYP